LEPGVVRHRLTIFFAAGILAQAGEDLASRVVRRISRRWEADEVAADDFGLAVFRHAVPILDACADPGRPHRSPQLDAWTILCANAVMAGNPSRTQRHVSWGERSG